MLMAHSIKIEALIVKAAGRKRTKFVVLLPKFTCGHKQLCIILFCRLILMPW